MLVQRVPPRAKACVGATTAARKPIYAEARTGDIAGKRTLQDTTKELPWECHLSGVVTQAVSDAALP